jgi:hypothetical protein
MLAKKDKKKINKISNNLDNMESNYPNIMRTSEFVQSFNNWKPYTPIAKKKIYYAHPMIFYGSQIEQQDVRTLEEMGFEVINPNSPGNEEKYLEKEAFGFFLDLVRSCDILAFRSIISKITYGTSKEIKYAIEHKIPIIELPYLQEDRYLDKGTTENYFRPAK